jgi:hypothetical protein
LKNINTLIKNNERSKAWYQANKNKPEFATQRKERLLRWRDENPARYLWQKAKERAAKYKVDFDLEIEDIFWPTECPALKVPFEYGTPYAASIDRIDNSKGYTKDNIQVISRKANAMKRNATKEELRNFAQWALKTFPL